MTERDLPARRQRVRLTLIMILLGAWLLAGAQAVASADVAEISIVPEATRLGAGNTATLTVQVKDAVGLYTAQLAIQYDPTLIEVLEIQAGPLLAGGEALSDIDNEGGSALFTITLVDPALAINGSGALMTMTVRGKGEGSSLLALEAMLSGADGEELPSRVKNAVIDVGDFPTATATSSAPPTATPTTSGAAVPPTAAAGGPTATAPTAGGTALAAASTTPGPKQTAGPTTAAPTMTATATPKAGAAASPTPTPTEVPAAPADAPSILGGLSQGPLPTWLFLTVLGILVFLIGVVTVIVLVALVAWYRRATQA